MDIFIFFRGQILVGDWWEDYTDDKTDHATKRLNNYYLINEKRSH